MSRPVVQLDSSRWSQMPNRAIRIPAAEEYLSDGFFTEARDSAMSRPRTRLEINKVNVSQIDTGRPWSDLHSYTIPPNAFTFAIWLARGIAPENPVEMQIGDYSPWNIQWTVDYTSFPLVAPLIYAPMSVGYFGVSSDEDFKREFNERAERWESQTGMYSSPTKRVLHEDYQSIMAMGTPAITLILNRMRKKPGNWFWALRHLAKFDAAKDTETFDEAVKAWLDWGKKMGHIS